MTTALGWEWVDDVWKQCVWKHGKLLFLPELLFEKGISVRVNPCSGSDIPERTTSDFSIVTVGWPGNIVLGQDALVRHVRELREKYANEELRMVVWQPPCEVEGRP
jgi:hypothetical protein